MVAKNDKQSIRYRQFAGGYAQALDSQLRAVLTGYQRGLLRRNEVRVFAGRLEQSALHQDSKVSLYRIINCQSQRKGNRRISAAEIQTAIDTLDQVLPPLQQESEAERPAASKPVARKVLRHIARGSATTVEALFCFAYFLRRIPQRKPMQRLQSNEHYARLRYAEFEAWTGVHRATHSSLTRSNPKGRANAPQFQSYMLANLVVQFLQNSFPSAIKIFSEQMPRISLKYSTTRETPRA